MLVLIIFFNVSVTSIAAENSSTETLTLLSDGSYYITTITEDTVVTRASTKSGTKTTRYYSSSNELLWSVSVKGTFSYTGSRATCTSSSVSASCYNDTWKIYSKSSSKSGDTATAKATAKKYFDGVVTKTVTKTVTLTCSTTGVLS